MRRTYQFGWLLRLVGLWFIGSLMLVSIAPGLALAQTPDDSWDAPLNLSHSGATTEPHIIIDSSGIQHVIWQDEFANFVYSQFANGEWTSPERTSLHTLFGRPGSQESSRQSQELLFTGPNPLFLAGPGQFTYAVWLTPQGSLFASRAPNYGIKNVGSWSFAKLISGSVVSFTAAIDAGGEMHIAYIRMVDATSNPAGIYYIHTSGNSTNLDGLTLLYESPYFRTLESGEANLSLATAGTIEAPIIYIAWDNRPRKQLLMATSMDGGENWDQPKQVAGPAPTMGVEGPFNVRVGAIDDSVVLVWQDGQSGGVCAQYSGSSTDAGVTWSGPHLMIKDLPGCAQTNEFILGTNEGLENLLFLLTNIQNQFYLSAWNGSQWSQPELQPILSGFEDPETYRQVSYDCHQAVLSGEKLYVVGCDEGRGGDIWITSRNLGTASSWFSPQDWSRFAPLSSENFEVSNIQLIATEDGLIHAFFSQQSDGSIYYTRWDGTTWSRIAPVMHLPDGGASWPAVATGPGNGLLLVARSRTGSLYYSRTNSTEAVNPSGWSTPVRIQTVHDGRVSPAGVFWDDAGRIYIAYSVPVNDDRGVYLLQSNDMGKTWSEPYQVFDGAAANFEVVGTPILHVTSSGSVYIMWKKQTIQADGVPQTLSLYFSRSEDSGLSFSAAESVIESAVGWREMEVDSQGNLHLVWQQFDEVESLWEQVSLDGGRSWQAPLHFPAGEGAAAVTVDPVGHLHLFEGSQGVVDHWSWGGRRWHAEAPAYWSSAPQNEGSAELLAAAVNVKGRMVLVLVAPPDASETEEKLLLFATRTIDLQSEEIATQEAIAPLSPLSLHTPTAPVPTAESAAVSLQNPTDNSSSNDPVSMVTRILFPVALLFIAALGIVSFRSVRNRAR